MTKVGKCTCSSAQQDNLYGNGQRVMNSCNKGYRCTSCGNIIGQAGEGSVPVNKEIKKK